MKYPSVILHPGREQSVSRRHQWIFSQAIRKKDKAIADGDIVFVNDAHGKVIATAHYQDRSLALRILEFGEVAINTAFWEKKLRSALNYRVSIGLIDNPSTNAFRLIHGEGDELPGLIVDIYDRVAVLQAHSIGMYRQRVEIAEALMQLKELHLQGVFDKSGDVLKIDETDNEMRWLSGSGPDQVAIRENGIQFKVDLVYGQKTGFFLDQRENRMFVKEQAEDKSVLNCFCYSGGFSLYALAGKASHVTSIDASLPALTLLEENLGLNGFEKNHDSIQGDVLPFLTQTNDLYDLVICDPPAFAKSMHKRHNAVQAYKRLNVLALKHVKPGGMLFTFSCSQVVDRQLFYDTIVAAAIEAGRPARVVHEATQAADHPVSVFHPEGSYLKGLALYLGS
jgi:23S rRNA (cytosine1962-C5)-methyltransferase